MKKIMQGIGLLLIVFAIADFWFVLYGNELTPFFPDGLSRFSPIIFGLIGGASFIKCRLEIKLNIIFNIL